MFDKKTQSDSVLPLPNETNDDKVKKVENNNVKVDKGKVDKSNKGKGESEDDDDDVKVKKVKDNEIKTKRTVVSSNIKPSPKSKTIQN
jgi:hypothetical protein